MKYRLKISALFVGQICLCMTPRMIHSDARRDYTSEVSTQPNISMSHDNFDVKVTYDVFPLVRPVDDP
jgi:hypothetical protein